MSMKKPPKTGGYAQIVKEREAEVKASYEYKQAIYDKAEKTAIDKVAEMMEAKAEAEALAVKQAEDAVWMRLMDNIIESELYQPEETYDLLDRLRKKGTHVQKVREIFELAIESSKRDKAKKERKEADAKIPKPTAYGSWA